MAVNARGIATVFIEPTDLEASRRFYGSLLGFPEVFDDGDHVVVFDVGGGTQMVLHTNHGEPYAKPGEGMSLYFTVDDVDGAVDELRNAGVTIAAEPQDEPFGIRDACVLDPTGFRVFLSRPLEA
jgi:catechol 2,3-dioxygenase-like lactoylglutathione lyase family enzyme